MQAYSPELEMIAVQNVMQCKMEHDKCRKTKQFKTAGQNLYQTCLTGGYPSTEESIKKSMTSWFDEQKLLMSLKNINSLHSSKDVKGAIGHFTQMLQAKAVAVGCAIAKSIANNPKYGEMNCIFIACNYASGNMVEQPVYEIGPLGSKCKTGMNPKYPGLCSEQEDYLGDSMYYTRDTTEAPPVLKWLKTGKKINEANSKSVDDVEAKPVARANLDNEPIKSKSGDSSHQLPPTQRKTNPFDERIRGDSNPAPPMQRRGKLNDDSINHRIGGSSSSTPIRRKIANGATDIRNRPVNRDDANISRRRNSPPQRRQSPSAPNFNTPSFMDFNIPIMRGMNIPEDFFSKFPATGPNGGYNVQVVRRTHTINGKPIKDETRGSVNGKTFRIRSRFADDSA